MRRTGLPGPLVAEWAFSCRALQAVRHSELGAGRAVAFRDLWPPFDAPVRVSFLSAQRRQVLAVLAFALFGVEICCSHVYVQTGFFVSWSGQQQQLEHVLPGGFTSDSLNIFTRQNYAAH